MPDTTSVNLSASLLAPHCRVPFRMIPEYRDFIVKYKLNLEIYVNAQTLDSISLSDVEHALDGLGYSPDISIHAPFMDLSPGASDLKILEITKARFRRTFELFSCLKPKNMVFHSGYEKWRFELKPESWLAPSLEFWPEFIKMAEDADTRIAIENIFEETPDNLLMLMEALGGENFGICFDVGHYNLFTTVTMNKWLDVLGTYIIESHVHDNKGNSDAHSSIGAGDIDFENLFGALSGRDVIYTIEALSPESLLKSMAWMRRYAQSLSA